MTASAALPLFSVATPTRNALGPLRRCVGSLRGQHGIHFEHLVQDACSTDGSPDWLAGQSGEHAALRSMSEPDGGMYDAINRAWTRAQGRYLSWLNADEQYLPGTLERVDAFFRDHPDTGVVFGDYLVTDAVGRAVAVRREIPLRRFYVANTFLYAQSCTLFFRRELWDRGLLRLDERFRYAADKDLVLRLMDAGVRFGRIDAVLSAFGIDGNNLSTHERMHEEAEAVRLAHGGFRWRPLRSLAYAGRRAERLWRGAYRPVSICYQYALDEKPAYALFEASNIGGRYNLANTNGRGQIVDAGGVLPAAPVPSSQSPMKTDV